MNAVITNSFRKLLPATVPITGTPILYATLFMAGVHLAYTFDLGVVSRLQHWWYGRMVPEDVQLLASSSLSSFDDEQDEVGEQVLIEMKKNIRITPRTRDRYASMLARKCKVAIPVVWRNTESNQLVAHRWLSCEMAKDDVRHAHRPQILAQALLFVRTKTKFEIEIEMQSQTKAYVDRHHDGEAQYFTRDTPWLFNWIGAKLRQPGPERR